MIKDRGDRAGCHRPASQMTKRKGNATRPPRSEKGPGRFIRTRLPSPGTYFREQGLKLTGGGEWKSALCPFHEDSRPSLRVRLDSGGFRCMACGAHGGDVLAFHMQLHGLGFKHAAKELGAWEEVR